MEAAEGRLHNGGWGEKWLDEVYETFLKHFAIVSKVFHPFHAAIHRCLDSGPPQTLVSFTRMDKNLGLLRPGFLNE